VKTLYRWFLGVNHFGWLKTGLSPPFSAPVFTALVLNSEEVD
jgi:hypothetical protein